MTTLAAGVLALVPATAAHAAGGLLIEPASGPPGTPVALTGSGFGRGASVLVSVRGAAPLRVRAGRGGGFTAAVTMPATASAPVRIRARSGKRRVTGYFVVAATTATSEAASSGGRRLRWSPREASAGVPVRIRGYGLRRRARGRAQFAPGPAVAFRTGRRGGFATRLATPEATPGPDAFTVTGAGVRRRLPFTVLPDPIVAGAGDIACGANSSSAQCKQAVTSDLLLQLAPTAVLALGDVQYEFGEYSNFLRFYDPTWGRLKAITHPVVGNHEYGTSDAGGCGSACGYFDYFNGPGQTFGPAGTRNEGFYAFDVGAWRLYAINSNCERSGVGCGPGSPQLRWLEADLAAHPRACSLMFMHHPLFTSDTRDFDNETFRTLLRPIWQAFYDRGGDVVLTGHSHFYERYARQDPQGRPDPARGIRQFIVGTGGRNVYDVGSVEPTSEVRGVKTFGVIRLGLHASAYDWQFVPEPGKPFTDAGSERCH